MNTTQGYEDLSTDELRNLEQVALRVANDALKVWQRERQKLTKIHRVIEERKSHEDRKAN